MSAFVSFVGWSAVNMGKSDNVVVFTSVSELDFLEARTRDPLWDHTVG